MKVRELQEQLNKLDSDIEVLCYSEHESLQNGGKMFQLLDIIAVSGTYAEQGRLDDGTPYLKLGKSPASKALAILEVTSDF